jgi:hypothetical protein
VEGFEPGDVGARYVSKIYNNTSWLRVRPLPQRRCPFELRGWAHAAGAPDHDCKSQLKRAMISAGELCVSLGKITTIYQAVVERMARADISEFESHQPSHAVVSSRRSLPRDNQDEKSDNRIARRAGLNWARDRPHPSALIDSERTTSDENGSRCGGVRGIQ